LIRVEDIGAASPGSGLSGLGHNHPHVPINIHGHRYCAKSHKRLQRPPGRQRHQFSIHQGECFGFLGPNGAGKTTVMRTISCFLPPTAGLVTVFGLDVTARPSDIKSRLGIMPQEDNLDPDLSVIENLVVYAVTLISGRKTASGPSVNCWHSWSFRTRQMQRSTSFPAA